MKTPELEEQLEAAIEVTEEGNRIIQRENPNDPSLGKRRMQVDSMTRRLNALRGFDAIEKGC